MTVEQIPQKPEQPNLKQLEKRINTNKEDGENFLEIGVIKLAACVERNQEAMQKFSQSSKGFGDIIKSHKLTISKK